MEVTPVDKDPPPGTLLVGSELLKDASVVIAGYAHPFVPDGIVDPFIFRRKLGIGLVAEGSQDDSGGGMVGLNHRYVGMVEDEIDRCSGLRLGEGIMTSPPLLVSQLPSGRVVAVYIEPARSVFVKPPITIVVNPLAPQQAPLSWLPFLSADH